MVAGTHRLMQRSHQRRSVQLSDGSNQRLWLLWPSCNVAPVTAGAIEFITVSVCGLIATYVKDVRCLTILVVSLISLGGLLGIRLTSLDHRWSLVGCSWLQGILGAPIILTWNILATDIAGHTKRSVTNGLWFTFYAGGNIVGSNIFDTREAPRYFSALTGMIVC